MFLKLVKQKKLNIFVIYLLIFLCTFIVYYLTSPKITSYNYFVRLASAFNNHRLYLLENPPWLNELAAVGNKYYVVYPPMPAILLIPFVAIFGSNFSQTIFSILLGSINPVILFSLLKRINISSKTSFLTTLFFTFGTNYWFLSTVGSAWYLAHVVALFFLFCAIWETFGKQRLLLIGLCLGASYWSRSTAILAFPFFIFYMKDRFWPINKNAIFNLFSLGLGIGFFVVLDGIYNYLRFSNISPVAPYSKIAQSQRVESLKSGFISFGNIPKQLDAIFLRLPHFQNTWPYIVPSMYSLAIWFTSPAIIIALKAKKSALMFSSWLAIFPIFFVISLWIVVGFSQFGYRFAQDYMPFLLILVALGIGEKPKLISYLLVFLSIMINFWGIIMINFLNLWTM